MNATIDRKAYRKHRKEGTPARYAFQIAKASAKQASGPDFSGLAYGEKVQWRQEGWSLTATVKPDHEYNPDFGCGTLYHRESAIPWREAADRGRVHKLTEGRDPVWVSLDFSPVQERREYARKHGKAYAFEQVQRQTEATLDRWRGWLRNDWGFCGVIVEARRNGVLLGSGSVWGVESDGDPTYFAELARDCAAEAIKEAAEVLAGLCNGAPEDPDEDA